MARLLFLKPCAKEWGFLPDLEAYAKAVTTVEEFRKNPPKIDSVRVSSGAGEIHEVDDRVANELIDAKIAKRATKKDEKERKQSALATNPNYIQLAELRREAMKGNGSKDAKEAWGRLMKAAQEDAGLRDRLLDFELATKKDFGGVDAPADTDDDGEE